MLFSFPLSGLVNRHAKSIDSTPPPTANRMLPTRALWIALPTTRLFQPCTLAPTSLVPSVVCVSVRRAGIKDHVRSIFSLLMCYRLSGPTFAAFRVIRSLKTSARGLDGTSFSAQKLY